MEQAALGDAVRPATVASPPPGATTLAGRSSPISLSCTVEPDTLVKRLLPRRVPHHRLRRCALPAQQRARLLTAGQYGITWPALIRDGVTDLATCNGN
jgi:hypothetical protein